MAQSISGMVANAIDSDQMVILTQPSDSTDTPVDFFTKLENTVVCSLIAHLPANAILASSQSSNETISKIAENFEITEIPKASRAIFSLETTNDVSDISFALLSQYDSSIQITPDSITYDIGTSSKSATKSLTIDSASSIYDSNIQFSYSYNSDPIKSTKDSSGVAYPINIDGDIPNSGPWTALFDSENSNVNYNMAVNSENNKANYNRPMNVEEYDTFNSSNALGMDLLTDVQHFYTLDTNGKPIAVEIPNTGASSTSGIMSASYRLKDNGVSAVKSTEFDNVTADALGSYRIQQFPDVPLVTITEDEVDNSTTSQGDISKFAMFNANATQTLPTNTQSMTQFTSLFGSSETIVPGYKYTATVTEDADSGYSLSSTTLVEQDATTSPIFSLDNSSLKDNQVYMKNYVNGDHTLSFTNSTLVIQPVGSASTSNVSSSEFSLNTQREYINQSDYQNGQIKLNTRTPTSRHNAVNGDLAVSPIVYYNTEGGESAGISNDLKTNRYAAFLDQLVMQNSSDIEGSFMKHNGTAIDLFNNSIGNSNFNTSDFEFSATGKTTNVPAEVIRITPSKQLASVNGFSKTDLSSVSGIFAFATLSNLKTTIVNADNVFDKSQILFNLKPLVGSKIKTSASTAGWSLVSSDVNGNMISSSASAFASDSTQFPSLELTKSLIADVSTEINFNISVLTDMSGDSTQVDQLRDEIKIEYWVTGTSNAKTELIIPQELLTKTQVGSDPAPVIGSAIPISLVDLSGKLSGKTINVYPVTAVKNYNYQCELPLRGFTGLTITTPTITSTTTYHIVKDAITLEQLPSSFHQYVKGGFYKNISESFSTISSISGIFDKNDLCDMLMKVVSKDTDGNQPDRDLTSLVGVSMYYGIDVKTNLNDADKEGVSSLDGDVTLRCECDYSNQANAEAVVTLNDNNGYLLKLTNKYDTNFSCDYWSATLDNITSNTSIACNKNTTVYTTDDKHLTVQNGYSSITSWNSSHKVVVTYADNKSTTIISIQNASNTELYEIRTKNFTYLNTQAFISNVSKDIHRVDSWIASGPDTVTDSGFVEKFIQVDYTQNVFEIYTGVYLSVSAPAVGKTTPYTQIVNIGKYYKFSLLQDQMGVDLLGTVSSMFNIGYNNSITNHVVTNNGLSFQYDNSNGQVTRVLTIGSWFRGYYGPVPNNTAVDQVYTISRSTMTAAFTIQRSSSDSNLPSSITQSWNVYTNDNANIVSNLSGSVGDIGLKITFYPSMLAPSDTTSFTVHTKGDTVSFTVVNPNSEVGEYYRPASSSTTLKSFVLDTFGGSNYNNTSAPLSINSYRLKIKTTNVANIFDNTSAAWSIELKPRYIKIYQNTNYLGNPVNIDTNDAYVTPSSSKWNDITPANIINPSTNYYDFIGDGITVNGWTFTRNTTLSSSPSVSFYVMSRPYYVFSMIQTVSSELPCDHDDDALRSIYLPIDNSDESNLYNPFKATKTYTYSDNSTSVTVANSQDVSNDVTFTKSDSDKLASFTTSSSKHHFVIEAPKLTVKLLIGLKLQAITQSIITLFDDLPANRLQYKDQESSPYFYVDTLINSNSGITMKLFQPANANTPYAGLSRTQIYSTQRGIDHNATISIDSFFIFPDSSLIEDGPTNNTFSLDLPTGNGNKVYMYTRESSVASNGDHVISIYRYAPFSNVEQADVDATNLDYNNIDATGATSLNTISAKYYMRAKKQFTFPISEFNKFIVSSTTELKTAFETFVKDYATKNNIVENFRSQVWSTAEKFEVPNGTYNYVFFSLVCPSLTAMSTIPTMFFSLATEQSPCKAVYVTKPPLLTAFNSFGVPLTSITAWGSMKLASVSATNVILNSSSNDTVNNSMSNILQKGVVGNTTSSVGIV